MNEEDASHHTYVVDGLSLLQGVSELHEETVEVIWCLLRQLRQQGWHASSCMSAMAKSERRRDLCKKGAVPGMCRAKLKA